MDRNEGQRKDAFREILLERKRQLWTELREELFGRLGEEYHAQFDSSLDVGDQGLADLLEDVGGTLSGRTL